MINPIDSSSFAIPSIQGLGGAQNIDKTGASGFNDLLSGMIRDVESANKEADAAVQGILTGEATDVHSVMLAVQKADITLKLALEVRNKLVEAYQEVMRTSV